MKSFQCFVLVLAAAVCFAGAFPRDRSSSREILDEETVIVPLEAQKQTSGEGNANTHIIIGGFGPPLDFGAPLVGGFGPQFGDVSPYLGISPHEPPSFLSGIPQPPAPSIFGGLNPFGPGGSGGFLGGLESGLALMRRQLASILNNVPGVGGQVAPAGGNTTSTTKVIDGHRITINETVYGNGYDGSVFKVRVVDVHPEKSFSSTEDEDTEGTTTQTNPHKSEVETMGKLDSAETTTDNSNVVPEVELNENASEASVKENTSDSGEKLSNDITEKSDEIKEINEVQVQQAIPGENRLENTAVERVQESFDRSVESLEQVQKTPVNIETQYRDEFTDNNPAENMSSSDEDEWKPSENNGLYEDLLETNNLNTNDISRKPIDLSNDINVNYIQAAAGVTADPLSEFIYVYDDDKIADDVPEVETNERSLRSLSLAGVK